MSHVDLHPDLLAPGALTWQQDDARAVLVPKKIALGPGLGLDGLRLVGDILEGESAASARSFVDYVETMLRTGDADGVLVEDLDTASALWRSIADTADRLPVVYPRPPQPHWWLRFPENPEDYWAAKFSGKSRYKLRRKAKKLEHSVTCVESPDQVDEFIEAARAVSEKSWQGKRLGVRIGADDRPYLIKLAEIGALRAYLLRHQEQPVAFVLGTQYEGYFSHEETGYDTEFASSSPGEILLMRLIEDLIARNCPRSIDFGAGDAEYKQRYGTDVGESGQVVMVAPRLRPRLVARAAELAKTVDLNARAALKRAGVYDRLRRLYRR